MVENYDDLTVKEKNEMKILEQYLNNIENLDEFKKYYPRYIILKSKSKLSKDIRNL